jgi:hypothetical protein
VDKDEWELVFHLMMVVIVLTLVAAHFLVPWIVGHGWFRLELPLG